MGWLDGLLTGYNDRRYEVEKENARLAEQAAAREEAAYKLLLSSKDPETRAKAGVGILQLGQPRRRKGGFAGWMGEMETSPIYPELLRMAQEEPEVVTEEYPQASAPTSPSVPPQAGAIPTQPAPAQSAALPATSPTVPGSPQLTQPVFAPGAGSAATPPPPPTFSLAPGAQNVARGWQGGGAVPPPNLRPNAQGPVSAASAGGTGQLLAGGGTPAAAAAPSPAAAAGAAGMMSTAAGMQPSGMTQPGVGAAAGPPPPPQGAVPGLPTVPAPPPPPPRQTTNLSGAPPPANRRTTLQYRPMFPTVGDLAADKERAEVTASIEGWQEMFFRNGDPDWKAKGIQAAMLQKHSAGGGGYNLMRGAIRKGPDGKYYQDMIDGRTAQVVATVEATTPGVTGGGEVSSREMIAHAMYGKQGEDPNVTLRQLQPWQTARVIERERVERTLLATEMAWARARVDADAPMSRQAQNAYIESLNTKWQKIQEPIREMERQFILMQTGVNRFKEDPNGGSQDILVTFQKILDPPSVVRESEYARSAVGLPLWSRLQGWYERLRYGGAGVPLADLESMLETSRQFLEGMQGWNDVERNRLTDRGVANGIDETQLFGRFNDTPSTVTPPPSPGSTGGPPSNTVTPTAGPADDWNKPLIYDPVTRKVRQ